MECFLEYGAEINHLNCFNRVFAHWSLYGGVLRLSKSKNSWHCNRPRKFNNCYIDLSTQTMIMPYTVLCILSSLFFGVCVSLTVLLVVFCHYLFFGHNFCCSLHFFLLLLVLLLVLIDLWNLTRRCCTSEQLMVFDNLEVPTHKTKNIVNYYKQMENTKKVLLVDGGPINEKLKLATQNLHYINVLPSIVSYTIWSLCFVYTYAYIRTIYIIGLEVENWYAHTGGLAAYWPHIHDKYLEGPLLWYDKIWLFFRFIELFKVFSDSHWKL